MKIRMCMRGDIFIEESVQLNSGSLVSAFRNTKQNAQQLVELTPVNGSKYNCSVNLKVNKARIILGRFVPMNGQQLPQLIR